MTSPTDAQRNTLFGLLAIRLDLLTPEDLIAALHDWVEEGKVRSVGPILVERGRLDALMCELLEPLVDRYIDVHSGDLAQSLRAAGPAPGVQAWLGVVEDPDLRAVLPEMEVVPRLRRTAHVTGSGPLPEGESSPGDSTMGLDSGPRDPDGEPELLWEDPAEQIGRYSLLRLLARGGLGEVFLARDESLKREVALKIIHRRVADNALCRARFQVEAEVTGGLEHPGIVPVYTIGRCEDGRPFYSMRLIRGESFQDAIRRLRAVPDRIGRELGLRKLLRHFIDVCNIVAYAHSRGVMHRDLKPSNIMLGRYGETMVIDWGLAKAVDRPEPPDCQACEDPEPALQPISGTGVTPTAIGGTLGTPRYMSPEQADGDLDRIGPISDVYSLGATLHFLLTGRDPLAEVQDLSLVLRRVIAGTIAPPSASAQDVPRTLEAICARAMALRPEDRYPTAKALAEDIEKYLADLPTSVPEPLSRRLGRWERRNRVLIRIGGAALLVIALMAIVAASMIAAALHHETRQQRPDETSPPLSGDEPAPPRPEVRGMPPGPGDGRSGL